MCEDYLNNVHLDFPDEMEKHEKRFLPYVFSNNYEKSVIQKIDNIHAQECGLYSDKYKISWSCRLYCRI